MSKIFYPLTVKKVRRETPDAITIVFDEIPSDQREAFEYTQGQYLTLKFDINGKELRRSYSMCSSPLEEHLAVTVKRVQGGKVSNYIHDHIKPGTQIQVMPPEGRFFTTLEEEQRKTYYLFGSGSGITPLMSILRTILEKEPLSTVFLLYGNRNEESIIFREDLEKLETKYADQLEVEHVLSRPAREKAKGLFGLLKKGTINWEGRVGRIDAREVDRFLESHPPRTKESEYFICGPGNMPEVVKEALLSRGVEKSRIHTEYFISADPESKASPASNGEAGQKVTVKVHLDGEVIELPVPENKSILDTLLDEGYDPPYSCTAGACSTCMAKVVKGSVKMEACYALDDEEVEEGYILTCQSHPSTEEVELTYDV